jgi:hypothetical protein
LNDKVACFLCQKIMLKPNIQYSVSDKDCEQTLSEEQCTSKCVHSMMPIIQINSFLYKTEACKNRVGVNGNEEREKVRSRLGECETERMRESEMAWVEK